MIKICKKIIIARHPKEYQQGHEKIEKKDHNEKGINYIWLITKTGQTSTTKLI